MIGTALAALVALLHAYFLYVEMFAWEQPRTRAAFGTTAEHATASKAMAANQGLYNGFLAAGIVFSLWQGEAGKAAVIFCLTCVVIAGLYAAMTVSRRILYIQALPAAIALVALQSGF